MDLSNTPLHFWPIRELKKKLEEMAPTTDYSFGDIQEEIRSRRTRALGVLVAVAICFNALIVGLDLIPDIVSNLFSSTETPPSEPE